MEKKTQYKVKCLFLYTELAAYTLACIRALEKKVDEVHIVRWPVNAEAPFKFEFSSSTKVYERSRLDADSLMKLVLDINPDLTYVSGWIDRGYLKVARTLKKKGPVIVGFDNHWEGNFKQQIASVFSFTFIKKYFTHAWIPGEPQYKLARKLGFSADRIMTGFYSADVDLFNTYYQNIKTQKANRLPRRFIYMGRYVEWKGVKEMWKAFDKIEDKKGWELWCAGTGDLYNDRPEIEGVKHIGFVQPTEMEDILKNTSVFILPSKFEPWGVAVHEYAVAGFPLICSDKVGASTAFLQQGKNGWLLKEVSVDSLKAAMQKAINSSDQELVEMGMKSRELAYQITPDIWAEKLLKIIE